ncbi:hypothetical protein DY000_02043044 [Brassica cretica]|uniref:PHD-type domain-containing protein n=1 Tax=Brassica cretica TaxID=69181 RepID=A0ABQ7B7T5_BRACR|nr:hypothetical protein DY000_02043044 [Brassica cretica]
MCDVCQSTDGDPSNPIVFCDLMVHASCYGNPLVKAIPEGDWFCGQCIASNKREKLLSCCLCTTKGGAMKPTKDGRWAHITCSLFVPEVYFEDPEGREGVCCSEIPSKRWEDGCYLCKIRGGCVIECSEMKCELAFHVTCGLKEDLCVESTVKARRVVVLLLVSVMSILNCGKGNRKVGSTRLLPEIKITSCRKLEGQKHSFTCNSKKFHARQVLCYVLCLNCY